MKLNLQKQSLEKSPHGTPSAEGSAERFAWVEVFRGLAILEVVFHHVSGNFLSRMEQGTAVWSILAALNRTMHFAVPAFLMLSGFVLLAGLLRRFSLQRYASNRLLKAFWPYLFWSGFYMLYRLWDYGGSLTWQQVVWQLLWGKAYFHLYFLAVAMQLYFLLPFVLPLFRNRPPFWMIFTGIVLLTMGVYWGNRLEFYRLPYPASFILWYTPTITMGLWLAGQVHRLSEVLKRGLPLGLLLGLGGLAFYVPMALRVLQKQPVDTFHYQLSNWCFTAGISFVLLYMAHGLSHFSSQGVLVLRFIGRYSLQIYLIHPLIIRELQRRPSIQEWLGTSLTFPFYLILALLIPLGIAYLLHRARVSVYVFGR
jgi:peptidoglycan/LPS O-acetylase OafA/YrhL